MITNDTVTEIKNLDWKLFLEEIYTSPDFWYVAIPICLILYLWIKFRSNQKELTLTNNDSGEVTVSRSALTNLIKNEARALKPNNIQKVSITLKRNKLYIKVRVRLYSNQNVEQFSEQLQTRLHHVLAENIGIDNIASINILVTDFTKKPSAGEETLKQANEVVPEEL